MPLDGQCMPEMLPEIFRQSLRYTGATHVEWDQERGTFGVWAEELFEELPAAAVASSTILQSLQRDHTCGVELPVSKAALLAWAQAGRGANEPASDWQQRVAHLQVRTLCNLVCHPDVLQIVPLRKNCAGTPQR